MKSFRTRSWLSNSPIVSFIVVGASTYLLFSTGTSLCIRVFGWPVWAAATFSYIPAVALHFTLSRRVFKSGKNEYKDHREVRKYIVLNLVSMLFQLTFTTIGINVINLPIFVATAIATGFQALLSYYFLKSWVFRKAT